MFWVNLLTQISEEWDVCLFSLDVAVLIRDLNPSCEHYASSAQMTPKPTSLEASLAMWPHVEF